MMVESGVAVADVPNLVGQNNLFDVSSKLNQVKSTHAFILPWRVDSLMPPPMSFLPRLLPFLFPRVE